MKTLMALSFLLSIGLQARADIYLQPGESFRFGRNTIFCGVEERQPSYFCTINSSFDGSFSGEGNTQLEAEYNAKSACKTGSRSNGFFCKDNTLNCQRSN